MKTTESKTISKAATAVAKTSNTPFFSKEAQDASPFFGGETVEVEPFFSPRTLQAKLTVGQPDDKYEQEADSVADKVVQRLSKSSPPDDPSVANGRSNITIHRKCAACEAEEEAVQRKPSNSEGLVSNNIELQLNSSKGGGSPLPDNTRASMESAMGADFSNVRVHTGSHAVQMSQDLNAQAFTHGSDVYFNAGKYNPSGTEGGRLLAHELTHTVQQVGHSDTIQRMLACPAHLNDSDSVPIGWKCYPDPSNPLQCGSTAAFHCGFRTILENRAPTPDDPMNECVYDHSGILVNASHPYAGCRGTPDQYDISTAVSTAKHIFIDSGGIVAEGVPAFITSRVYEINTAIATAMAVPNAIISALGSLLVQSIFTGQAICSPSNWTYHAAMPSRSRAHLNVIGIIISSVSLSGNLNNLLRNLTKPLGDFPIAQLPTEIAPDVNIVLNQMGSQERISPDVIRRLSLFQLIEWLKDHGVIMYNRPPDEIAREQIRQLLEEPHQ